MNDKTADRFELEQTEAKPALPVAPARIGPRGLPPEQWEMIADDLRPEALDRAAWLIFRGESLDEALIVAMDGMRDDLEGLDFEPAWDTIRRVAAVWPIHGRSEDGRFRKGILIAASKIEQMVAAEILMPGSIVDPEGALGRLVDPASLEDCRQVYEKRLAAQSLVLLQPAVNLEDRDLNPTNSLDSPGSI